MAASYIVASGSVELTSANNEIMVNIGGSSELMSLPVGVKYWTGLQDSTNLLKALADAIEAHSTSPTVTMSPLIYVENPDTPKVGVNIGCSASFQLLWEDATTTLDGSFFGFNVDTVISANNSSDSDTKGVWVADQPIGREEKGPLEINTDQHRAMDGRVFTFNRGSKMTSHAFFFDFISPQITLELTKNQTAGLSGERRTFESFWTYVSDGKPMRVHKGVAAGSTMAVASYGTFDADSYVGEWIMEEDTINVFAPSRYSAGLELYAFPLTLRKKV